MRGPGVVIGCLLLATTAHAERLRMKRIDSTNVHIGDGEGAINTQEDVTITIDLGGKRKASVKAVGLTSDGNLFVTGSGASYYTEDRTQWTTSWTGVYTRTRKSLTLELALVKDDCKAEHITDGRAAAGTCETPTARAQLVCTLTPVEIEPAVGSTATKPRKASAWSCALGEGTTLGESGGRLLFGTARCLEVGSGRMGGNFIRGC